MSKSQSPISGQVRRTGSSQRRYRARIPSQSPISGQVRRTLSKSACRAASCTSQSPISGQVRRTNLLSEVQSWLLVSQSPISGQVRRTSSCGYEPSHWPGHKALSAGRCDGQCLLQPLPRLPFRGGKGERGQKPGRKCVHHPSEKSSCDLSMRCSGVNPTITTAVFSKSKKSEALESSTSRAGLSYRRGARSVGQKCCRQANERVLAPAGG